MLNNVKGEIRRKKNLKIKSEVEYYKKQSGRVIYAWGFWIQFLFQVKCNGFLLSKDL